MPKFLAIFSFNALMWNSLDKFKKKKKRMPMKQQSIKSFRYRVGNHSNNRKYPIHCEINVYPMVDKLLKEATRLGSKSSGCTNFYPKYSKATRKSQITINL